jgi:TfoX/Sxy family transcriptional regulator of competence genes
MGYDERLAQRIHNALAGTPGLRQRRMFGGLCILVRGHMAAGIVDSTLMLRVGPAAYADALAQPHVRPMDFTGRPLAGMVYVDPPGIVTGPALRRWLKVALAFVASLPPKAAKGAKTAKRHRTPKRRPSTR